MGKMITISTQGSFGKTETYFKRLKNAQILSVLNRYGQVGVNALSAATPVESGETSESWYYTVNSSGGVYTLSWHNRHVVDGVPIAIILQYGHGTGTGGYVAGRDYINPSIKPVFDQIKADVWKEVTS